MSDVDEEVEAETCPKCGGPVESVVIDGHESWACPVDASAWSKDQGDEFWWAD